MSGKSNRSRYVQWLWNSLCQDSINANGEGEVIKVMGHEVHTQCMEDSAASKDCRLFDWISSAVSV